MRLLSFAAITFAFLVSASAASAPAVPAGNYTLSIRQTSGPLTDAYVNASTLPVVISSAGLVTIANAPGVPCSMQGSILQSSPTPIPVSKGHLSGATVTVQLSINVVNASAAGGIFYYTIDEDGRTKSGNCTFTLAPR